MDNFESRLAASMKIAAVQRPDFEPESINSNRSNRRAGFMALAAAAIIGVVIAGTTFLFNPGDSPSPAEPAGQWKTIEYKGVQVDVPSDWIRLDVSKCQFPFEGWGASESEPCEDEEGVRFVGKDLPAQSSLPGEISGDSGGSRFSGYVEVADLAVSASGPSRELVQRVLDSAREADASPIDIEGEWVLSALTDAEGKALLSRDPGPMHREMPVEFDEGRLRATMNCSEVTATYEQSGNRDIGFSNIESDVNLNGVICNPIPPLAERLQDVRHISEDGDKLQLHAENWMIVAVLERAESSEVPGLFCSGSLVSTVQLNFGGPGKPTPEEAVALFADGRRIVRDPSSPGVVYAVNSDGSAYRTFEVVKRADGWWPSSYEQCPESADTPTPESTQTPASSQNPPRRMNMQVVRQFGGAQEFRTYSGPAIPPTTESEAIASVQGNEVYSLGLHDIGFVHYSGSIEWHSVWIIAADSFVSDLNSGKRGGAPYMGPKQPVSTPTPEEPRPGWSRSVTMIDVATGKDVMSLVF